MQCKDIRMHKNQKFTQCYPFLVVGLESTKKKTFKHKKCYKCYSLSYVMPQHANNFNPIQVGRGSIRPPPSNICFKIGLMGSGGPHTH